MVTTSPPESGGPLKVYALEVHAVQHCNLRCLGCAQLSPLLPRGYESPDTLEMALRNLALHLVCEKLQILGGEPLLHPQIVDILSVSARSGLASKLTVKTNGLLLHRVPADFWRLANEVIVSVYPATEALLAPRRVSLERSAASYNTALVFRYFPEFQEIATKERSNDEVRTLEIYKGCNFKTFTHSLRDGRIYRCAPSVNLVRGHVDLEENDSLDVLNCDDLREQLEGFLTSPKPLRACAECMGSAGATFPHTMEPTRPPASQPL